MTSAVYHVDCPYCFRRFTVAPGQRLVTKVWGTVCSHTIEQGE